MNRQIYFICLLLLLLLLVACTSDDDPTAEALATEEPAPSTQEVSGRAIVIAEISDDPASSIRGFQPLADYLAANLSEFGITSGEVRVAPDLATMTEMMVNGEVDLFFDSLYPALIISDGSGAQPILRRWKDGVSEYYTVIFALADSGITSIEDLNGRVIAFEEIFSTSGYMLPSAYLIGAGMQLQAVDSPESEVPDEVIGYTFTNNDANTLQWVISGVVSAAATDIESYNELPQESLDALTIIAQTDAIPRQVVLANASLEAELVTAISLVLQGMDETEEGIFALEAFETAQFDEFPEGIDQALNDMRAMYESVQGQ